MHIHRGDLSILLVEDSLFDAELLEEELREVEPGGIHLDRSVRLSEALHKLSERRYDVVLLDLTLPDVVGVEAFQRLSQQAPETPVIVLTGLSDSRLAVETVRQGAQDYLIKDDVDGKTLMRSIVYSIERKGVQLEAERLRRHAEEMSRRKTEFLAVASHELRNPMTGILGFTHLLAGTELTPTQREFVDALKESARSLADLLQRLLDFSSAESGNIAIEKVPFRLREGLEEVLRFVSVQAREAGLEVVGMLDPMLPQEAIGDRLKLRQVILNLLVNAIKFTEKGYVGLSAQVASKSRRGLRVRFVVEDSGRGIPPHQKRAIFQPFRQTRSSDRERGSGLGLAICWLIVEAMGGTLGVESEVGKGTAFWFDLPFEVTQPSPLTPDRLQDLRVLVAHSHPQALQATARLLRRLGATIEEARDGSEALQLAAGSLPDVLIAAEELPPHGGVELAQRLKLIPIRLVSSYQQRGKLSSGASWIAWPLRLDELLTHLESPRAQAPVSVPSVNGPTAAGARILVVDDDGLCARLTQAVMQGMGHSCRTASCVSEAVDLLKEEDYDLLVTDCGLPDGSGFELASAVRRLVLLPSTCPILALTGSTEEGVQEECRRSGMSAYLCKPVEGRVLEAQLRELLTPPPALDRSVLDGLRCYETDSNQGFVQELVETYLGMAAERMQEIEERLTPEREPEIPALAHRLKGAAASIGATSVAATAGCLEGKDFTLAKRRALAIRLSHEVARSVTALERYLAMSREEAAC
ncbi:MAG: response regulator [Armatimonadetes bacterium]|nr:response regulator [Armatimonadota bacterium]